MISIISEQATAIGRFDIIDRSVVDKILEEQEKVEINPSLIQLTKEDAAAFYSEHEGKPFFDKLVSYMISSPIVVQVLEGENAVKRNRELMGATNPSDAEPGTLRYDFAESIDANAVHGSDSIESAEREINFFFQEKEIF